MLFSAGELPLGEGEGESLSGVSEGSSVTVPAPGRPHAGSLLLLTDPFASAVLWGARRLSFVPRDGNPPHSCLPS